MPTSADTMGPPSISPLSLVIRYLTARAHSVNLDEMPKAAEIHIQTRAPGPPVARAEATPAMLPVPMVAARAVHRQAKGETSPVPRWVVRASLDRVLLMA